MPTSPSRRLGLVAAAAGAALVLAPYSTVALPFQLALYVQAALVLAVVGAAAALGLAAGRARRLRELRPRLGLALGAWTAALLLGTAVALVRGNDPGAALGQVVSLALLPLGTLAAIVLGGRDVLRPLSAGLVAGVTAAVVLHLADWAVGVIGGDPVLRLYMGNAVSAVGPALPALLLAFGLAAASAGRWRLAAAGASALILVYVVGSATRGLWLAVLLGCGLFVALSGRTRRALRRGAAWQTVGLVVAGLAAVGAGTTWLLLADPADDVLDVGPSTTAARAGLSFPEAGVICGGAPRRGAYVVIAEGLPVGPGETYRLSAARVAGRTPPVSLAVDWLDGRGRFLAGLGTSLERSGSHAVLGVAPADARSGRVTVIPGGGSRWCVRARLERLTPAYAAILRQTMVLSNRTRSLVAGFGDPAESDDPGVTFRWHESRRVLAETLAASWPWKLLGHGLGATVRLDTEGFDNRGNVVYYGEVNYIHNYYLFLIFKLGAVGTVLTIGALALLVGEVARGWRRAEGSGRELAAAVLAAFLAALAWSLLSPVVLDFRLAPIWGMLVAAAAAGRDPAEARVR